MKSSAAKIQMTTVDDLFLLDSAPKSSYRVQEIPLPQLFGFKNHPFLVLDDEKMQETVESVAQYGVLVPAIARPRSEGAGSPCASYELIAGHRRKRASELAGKDTMPVLVRDLDDDAATIIMVDSNIQRENLLPSEKARAYKMKLDALKHQGIKDEFTSRQVGEKSYSVDVISKNSNDSARNIHRFIRLTELIPTLLQMVDDKKLVFNTAVELSYLSVQEQEWLLTAMTRLVVFPSLVQAVQLKKYHQEGKLGETVIDAVLSEGRPAPLAVTIKSDRLKQYFPTEYTQAQMEEVIFSLLESWRSQNKSA